MTSPKSRHMKSSVPMILTLLIMTISLSGQSKFTNHPINDLKLDSINIDFFNRNNYPDNLYQTYVYHGSKPMTEKDYLSKLYHDKNLQLPPKAKINHDFIIASETPAFSRNIDNMPIIKPPMNGYIRILKPDTTVIYYIRGQNSFRHRPGN